MTVSGHESKFCESKHGESGYPMKSTTNSDSLNCWVKPMPLVSKEIRIKLVTEALRFQGIRAGKKGLTPVCKFPHMSQVTRTAYRGDHLLI